MSKVSKRTIESVYRSNADKLYRFFYFKVLNQQVAEDLTSDTFVALAEKLSTIDDDKDTVEKYLYGIARNKWNMYLRDKYKRDEFETDSIDDFSIYVDHEVDTIQSMSLKERAIRFITMLPPKQRVVAMLRLIEGLMPSEISVRINKPLNYVKVTLRRALVRLRELIATSQISDIGGQSQ